MALRARRILRLSLLGALMAASGARPSPLLAQAGDSAAASRASRPAALCFRGGPPSRCQSFLILQVDLAQRVAGVGPTLFGRHPAIFDSQGRVIIAPGERTPARLTGFIAAGAGLMVNRARGDAVGGLIQLGADFQDNQRFALIARERRPLGSGFAADFDAGAIELSHGARPTDIAGGTAYGVTTGAAIDYADLLALTAHVDAAFGRRGQIALTVGARSGSYTSLLLAAGTALLAAAFAHSLD
jgi:hypothetical protein